MKLVNRRKKVKLNRKNKGKNKGELKHNTLVEIYKLLQDVSSRSSWFSGHRNACCVSCDVTQKHMVRVGIVILCFECFNKHFDSKAESRSKKAYSDLCKIYDEKLSKEMEEESF